MGIVNTKYNFQSQVNAEENTKREGKGDEKTGSESATLIEAQSQERYGAQ